MAEVMRHCTNFSLTGDVPQNCEPVQTLVLIVLNCELPRFTPVLWNQARLRVCADGGANRIFDELPKLAPQNSADVVRQMFKPDAIVGDLDSLRPDVRDLYSEMGTPIIDLSNDQDSTDFEKSINFVVESSIPNLGLEAGKLKYLVMGALAGRFDHVAAHINVLHKFSHLRIVLFSDESLVYLLPHGYSHEIVPNLAFEGPHCGLIPFGTVSESTTTTGLQWNMDHTRTAFGALVSTSNSVTEKIVTVVSDTHLIWTISLRDS